MKSPPFNHSENTSGRRRRSRLVAISLLLPILLCMGGCSFSQWFGFLPFVGKDEPSKPLRDYMVLGKHYFAQKKLDQALTEYNRAIYLYPEESAPYHGRAWIYLEQGHYQAAEYDFDKAISLDRGFAPAYLGRSLAKEGLGEYKGAAEDLEWYLALEPNDTDAAERLDQLKRYPDRGQ